MAEKKRKLLTTMIKGAKVADLIGPKGDYYLKEGDNKIKVMTESGVFVRTKVVTYTGLESKVQKSMQDETDIRYILKKYGRDGVAPIVQNPALYGDFSNLPEWQESQEIIRRAEEQFSLLDSDTRKLFDNDPGKMLDFCSKEENLEKMRELGLAKPKEEPAGPIPVQVINPEPKPQE